MRYLFSMRADNTHLFRNIKFNDDSVSVTCNNMINHYCKYNIINLVCKISL